MLGCASVAQRLLPESSPALPALNDVIAAARRAAELTRQLLAYSGKGRFEVRAIDLSEHVREITHLLEATLPKKVRLELELDASLPAVEADHGGGPRGEAERRAQGRSGERLTGRARALTSARRQSVARSFLQALLA